MAKQNFGSGLEQDGPPRQGEKGGKGGMQEKEGMSEFGGNRTQDEMGDTGQKTRGNPIGKRHTEEEMKDQGHF